MKSQVILEIDISIIKLENNFLQKNIIFNIKIINKYNYNYYIYYNCIKKQGK